MTQPRFDLSVLDPDERPFVEAATERLHMLERRTGEAIIEIGRILLDVKSQLGHGQFGEWLASEFGWSISAASKFMQAADVFGDKSVNFTNIAPSALYALASGSMPEPIREEFVARAEAGERIAHKDVRQRLAIVDLDTGSLVEPERFTERVGTPFESVSEPASSASVPVILSSNSPDLDRRDQEESNRLMGLVGDPDGNIARARLKAAFSKAQHAIRRDLLGLNVPVLVSTLDGQDRVGVDWFIKDTREWLISLETELNQGIRIIGRKEA